MAGRYSFIVNFRAGASKMRLQLARASRLLRDAGHHVDIHETTAPHHAVQLASNLPDDTTAAIAVGGDGTIREIAQGLIDRSIPLAVLPSGTENLFAKQFGISESPQRLVDSLLAGAIRTIDVGWFNHNLFLLLAGIGFDAEVVQRLHRNRMGHITHLNYFWPILRTFCEHRFPALRVTADGKPLFEGYGFAFVANMPRYALNLRICKKADQSDGLLDLCIFPCAHQGQLILHAAFMLFRVHLRCKNVIYRQVTRVRIESENEVPFQVDGDPAGVLPAEFSIGSRQLQIIVPRHYSLWRTR